MQRSVFGIMCFATVLFMMVLPRTTCGQMIIAHRGASYDAPENTLAAFRLAFEKGADGVEGDFRLSQDGQIVCVHDKDMARVSGNAGKVHELSLEELKKLDVGTWKHAKWADQRVPTLEEVIGVIPDGKRFFIELKTGPEIVAPLKKTLEKSTFELKNCVIISFDADTVAACRQRLPKITCHWLTGYDETRNGWTPNKEELLQSMNRCGANGLGCQANLRAFNRGTIEFLAANGKPEFHVWTVDDIATARHYRQLGAVGITTNRPAYIRAGLAKDPSAAGRDR